MPRAPKHNDFIPQKLTKDRAQHGAILATARNQKEQKGYGRWASHNAWEELRYLDGRGIWMGWDNSVEEIDKITHEDILGTEPETRTYVEVETTHNGWQKAVFIGQASRNRTVAELCSSGHVVTKLPDQVRPYRDAEQQAIDKLKTDGHIVTNEVKRTVKVLNTLGLLKD